MDTLIENCDQVINLREVILEARLQYSISGVDEKTRVVWLDRAVQAVSIGLRVDRNMQALSHPDS